ncbi:MAG TPA: hypothetical protein VFF68_11735, partial [Anaerolineaceae bacterium]|nr:hypothetical protein [Anaerolineaceae bacterium]
MKKTERVLQVGKRWLDNKVRKSINALYLPERASLYRRLGPLLEAVNARLTLQDHQIIHLVS